MDNGWQVGIGTSCQVQCSRFFRFTAVSTNFSFLYPPPTAPIQYIKRRLVFFSVLSISTKPTYQKAGK